MIKSCKKININSFSFDSKSNNTNKRINKSKLNFKAFVKTLNYEDYIDDLCSAETGILILILIIWAKFLNF